ncbi:MAG TPA: exo-alpha-sialidase [Actinocrinis sp.]|nr:exo-alpha-sialidase [Actinocrinis sp.]
MPHPARTLAAIAALALVPIGAGALPASAAPTATAATPAAAHAVSLTQVSSDPYTDSQAQHATEVEPDVFSFNSTVVSAFQVGRVSAGGATNIGWSTSADGGSTWSHGFLPDTTANTGQPLVQPSGTVIVPFASASANQVRSFESTNGGTSWNASVLIATTKHHTVSGLESDSAIKASAATPNALRESVLPSAEIDAAGEVYVTWADCRFRTGCASNDIILSTSADGTTWSTPTRVPIDAITSTDDHFTPGIGVDASTSGSTTRIGLTYYFYPAAKCSTSTCKLDVGYISSTNGGSTWSTATQLAGPMTDTWLPDTTQGRMFGDYIATTILPGGNAITVIPVAAAPSGTTFNMAMFSPSSGLPVVAAK